MKPNSYEGKGGVQGRLVDITKGDQGMASFLRGTESST